jgi:putative DNA methylase
MNMYKKKLIEVALPLEAINIASAQEKQPGIGAHPRGLHLWWARRPLAAARAVIFAQMVDDPSAHPDIFKTEKAQEKERERLFRIIEELVLWKNTTNEEVLQKARDEIWQSWRYTCAENADHPRAKELFDRFKLPGFHDPFAGGGALPLEAQRLGLESYASDLNPVAVLINKAMIEIPPKFVGKPPVNTDAQHQKAQMDKSWKGAQGLAEDVRFYGQWMRDEAEKRIGHLYPKIEITAAMAQERQDLKKYVGQNLTVIAWLWARTVKSPNPAFANIDVPLASTFMLSTKAGKEAYVEPVIEGGNYHFTVKVGKPKDAITAKNGTKVGRGGHFQCLMSGTPIPVTYIRDQGLGGTLSVRLMAIVAEGSNGRVYLAPDDISERAAAAATPSWFPEQEINYNPRDIRTQLYGLTKYGDLFTSRQLVALTTFSDLVQEVRVRVKHDAIQAGLPDDGKALVNGGTGGNSYADAVAMYLAFAISRLADYNSSIATWKPSGEQVMQTYKRQALPMAWDFPESNVLGQSAICWKNAVKYTADNLLATASQYIATLGFADQRDASTQSASLGKVVSTDPPYYDNIGYADLSDFFYVWLRRSLKPVFPDLFATLAVPKAEELVATPYRHGSKEKAEIFFLQGMTQAMHRLAEQAHPAFPVTIYYAFKQAESDGDDGTTNTGWDTFLAAVIEAGFAITGTWPMRTELSNRMISSGTNALASSIVLVCRQRSATAPTATRRELVAALKAELPQALAHLQAGNIAPVDLAQAAIGPGMAIYTRYAKVLDAEGKSLSVRAALALINQTLDEVLAEQEGDFDADSRFALAWFEQYGFAEGEFGVADVLARAKGTAVAGVVEAGIVISGKGKVRLLKPAEMPADWDPTTDTRLTVWEMVHHLIRVLEAGGEGAAAVIVAKLGSQAETARELCYRLYTLCERKKRANEAMAYNGLVQSWPEITRLARETPRATLVGTADMFKQE